jgi:hypothetical protein
MQGKGEGRGEKRGEKREGWYKQEKNEREE